MTKYCSDSVTKLFAGLCVTQFFLGSASAYANKMVIPDARPINTLSVSLFDECTKSSKLPGCQKIKDGIIPISPSDFIAVPAGKGVWGATEGIAIFDVNAGTELSAQPPLSSYEEKLLVGLTDFLADRAKQEAQLYLQEQLTDELCKEDKTTDNHEYKHSAKIFEKTCLVIKQLNSSNYSISGASLLLRSSIRDDLRNYPDIYLDNKYSDTKEPKWLQARIALAIFGELRGSRDIGEIIGGLVNLPLDEICISGGDTCIKQVKTISNRARVYWTLSENLRAMREHLKHTYYAERKQALLFAIAGTMNDPSLNEIWGDRKKIIAEELYKLVDLIEVTQNYRSQLLDWKTQERQSETKDQKLAVRLRATLSGIDTLYQLSKILNEQPLMERLHSANVLAQAIIEEDYARIALELSELTKESGEDANNRYIPLMVELASAQTSADMQKIFETAAAPAGSYREKFKSDSLTSITAFAGVARGREWYNYSGAGNNYDWQPFLPVGVQATKSTNIGVLGAFVSIIDLGPLAAERHNNGATSNTSNTGWVQAFSPGLYATWNPTFARPLVFGFGISKTPKLVTAKSGEQVDATRRQFFLAIDMTLFAFR